jgi:hypothetical protein
MTTNCLEALSKRKEKRVKVLGVVETGYQTQKRQCAQRWEGGIKQKA